MFSVILGRSYYKFAVESVENPRCTSLTDKLLTNKDLSMTHVMVINKIKKEYF